jgi:hypothetical protein
MPELDPESRELFQAARNALRPSATDRVRIRDALRLRITGVSHVPGAVSATSAGSGLGWLSFSALAAAVVVGGVLLAPRSPQVPSVASAPSLVRSAEAPAVPPASAVAPEPPARAAPPPTPAPTPEVRATAKPRPSDSLAQEVALLSRAETERHAGRFNAALQLLNAHQKAFPRGLLRQERVAARIQALCGLGRVKEANADLARITPGSLHDGPTREACSGKASK